MQTKAFLILGILSLLRREGGLEEKGKEKDEVEEEKKEKKEKIENGEDWQTER